ncbi:lysine transporter LysE [Cellulomonas soli]|uniref:lysine transporter LysE n=1 Tax=Cellulomonas soli TaxID=931535 RepID=UPI003F866B0C
MPPGAGSGAALLVGVLAGLAVAVPVGPVGVLLLREGLVRGTRVAVGAALGVASVDAVYAVLAVLVGVPVGRAVEAHADLVRLTSAGVLLLVGAVGVVGAVGGLRAPGPVDAAAPDGAGGLAGIGGRGCPAHRGGTPRAAYARFVALTAVNPTTAVTFATVAVGAVAGLADASSATVTTGRPGPGVGAAFVVGVALASAAWQLVLALGAGLLGGRVGVRGRTALSLGGSLVVVALAGVLALG